MKKIVDKSRQNLKEYTHLYCALLENYKHWDKVEKYAIDRKKEIKLLLQPSDIREI
jgi:hypothetical protein|tara:strand:- start:981 stop:1148 length:168 start_codon:yes stop_codon:yes gene_type:complete